MPPLLAFLAALVATGLLARSRLALDRPNRRSLHQTPVPRTGGIGILAGVSLGLALGPGGALPVQVWAGVGLLFALSLLDDLRSLPVVLRFGAHGLAAVLALSPLSALLGWSALALAVLAAMWMTNLYNFMDGSDGLAGGMTLFGFGSLGLAAALAGELPLALVGAVTAAAAGAFLVFNFHPARIFMGDAGSIPLGFLAACLGAYGTARGLWPIWFAPLVFSPFIVDASVTLAKRLLRGEKVWQAHREHYYQRLVRLGFGHRGTAWIEYALMAGAGASGLAALRGWVSEPALALSWLAIYAVSMTWVDVKWRSSLAHQPREDVSH